MVFEVEDEEGEAWVAVAVLSGYEYSPLISGWSRARGYFDRPLKTKNASEEQKNT